MANTSVSLVDLDFDTIKSNLKTYLKRSDSPFKDVDFEGSNISQLLDVLSYNTYLNSYYLNMVASEMFLDTAQLRDSVISHAKELNYVPRSFTSADARIAFNVTPSSAIGALVVPKGTTFTTKIGSNNYSFATDESVVLSANTDGKFYANLVVYEGVYTSDSYVYVSSNTSQRFVLSNPTVDTRSITVTVIEDSAANVLSYSKASSYLGQSNTSQIYFLQAAENSQYEIVFGDGVIGRQPKNGSTIVIEYRTCNGELPNGARVFDIDGAIQGQSNVSSITTISAAAGGSVNETLEAIKQNAVRHYQNQDRAVTATDFETILSSNFPEIQAISAYGGEEVDPPQYGKVYISVDLQNADGISQSAKDKFYTFIKPRTTVSIDPVFIDPEFLYVEAQVQVKYNVNTTTLKTSDISTIVKSTISAYNTTNLNGFKKTLYFSQLVEDINKCHASIVSNDLHVVPFKLFAPTTGSAYSKTLEFGMPLSQYYYVSEDDFVRSQIKAVYSTFFTFDGKQCVIQDDNNGKLAIYATSGFDATTKLEEIGTVDYATGKLVITNLVVDSYTPASGSHMHIYVNPLHADITTGKNFIISIRDADIEVGVEAVKL